MTEPTITQNGALYLAQHRFPGGFLRVLRRQTWQEAFASKWPLLARPRTFGDAARLRVGAR
jgi:hypothetical protein